MRFGLEPTTPPTASAELRRIRRLVLVVLSLTSGVIGALVIGRMHGPEETASLIAFGATTALFTYGALWLAMRRTSTAGMVALRVMGFSIAAGALNAPAAYVAGGLASSWQQIVENPYQVLIVGAAPIVLMLGLPWSLSFGLVFGVVLAAPAAFVAHLCEEQTLTTRAHALLALGLFVAALPIAVLLTTHVTIHPFSEVESTTDTETTHSSAPRPAELRAAIGLPLVGLTLFSLGLFRLATQRRWLRRIRSGELPGWALEPATGAELADTQLLPFSDAHRNGTLIVVRETPDVASDPYRSQSPRIAWARVAPHPP